MEKLITHNAQALRFLITEDIYMLDEQPAQVMPPLAEIPVMAEVPVIAEPVKEALPPQPIAEAAPPPNSFNYLGENNRYFLIIVDDPSHSDLNNTHKDMLMKIMGAKKLELRDLAILNLAKYPGAAFPQLKEFFSCNRITLFGIDPQRIALPAMAANIATKHRDVKILATFSLSEMSSSVDKKREFWNVMKDF